MRAYQKDLGRVMVTYVKNIKGLEGRDVLLCLKDNLGSTALLDIYGLFQGNYT